MDNERFLGSDRVSDFWHSIKKYVGEYTNAYSLYAYDGVNIKEKFAGEMEYTEPWVWIQQRLVERDISGLHIKDWFELTVNDNSGNPVMLQMQIADINHDMGFASPQIKEFHIDFIGKGPWPEPHVWNRINYNNGIANEPSSWLCSDIYAWLNSKKMNVPNAITANPDTFSADYTTDGVFDKFPISLQNVIIERSSFSPSRYSNSGILTDDNGFGRGTGIGNLWIPNETEVHGQIIWGTKNGYSVGIAHQFPIFMDGRTHIKYLDANGNRSNWWLSSAVSNNSTSIAFINTYGIASSNSASATAVYAPVCFRISG